jgi:hypothetical protein
MLTIWVEVRVPGEPASSFRLPVSAPGLLTCKSTPEAGKLKFFLPLTSAASSRNNEDETSQVFPAHAIAPPSAHFSTNTNDSRCGIWSCDLTDLPTLRATKPPPYGLPQTGNPGRITPDRMPLTLTRIAPMRRDSQNMHCPAQHRPSSETGFVWPLFSSPPLGHNPVICNA